MPASAFSFSVAGPSGADTIFTLGRPHARRLREIYRSAGWPCQDLLEVELLAAGLVQRMPAGTPGAEYLRVTDAGIALLASTLARNRAAMSAHEALVEQVAREMVRAGRIAWRGLSLRALVPHEEGADAPAEPASGVLLDGEPGSRRLPANANGRWCIAKPDVFSIRNTTVEAYAQPVVHEVKVRRADLLGDLRQPAKRAAYLDLGGECWYVLGSDARGRCIADPHEVPAECGVLVAQHGRLEVARAAPRRAMERMPFGVWMALARATPVAGLDEDAQGLLGEGCDGGPA